MRKILKDNFTSYDTSFFLKLPRTQSLNTQGVARKQLRKGKIWWTKNENEVKQQKDQQIIKTERGKQKEHAVDSGGKMSESVWNIGTLGKRV